MRSPSGRVWLTWRAWFTISEGLRLRLRPRSPVRQKLQAMAQPTWEDMHRVSRGRLTSLPGSGMSTDSMWLSPSNSQMNLRVPSWLSSTRWVARLEMKKCSPSLARVALAMLVISENSVTPFCQIHL